MSDLDRTGGPEPELTQRLERAMNHHDLDALVGCFAEDYRNETPAHPARSFRGRDQVRRNWQQILGSLPDLSARLVRWAVNADTLWAEWDWSGTRPDGVPVILRGVNHSRRAPRVCAVGSVLHGTGPMMTASIRPAPFAPRSVHRDGRS